MFSRFQHLLEQSGAIKPMKVDGRAVATLPRNPAQAAAEMQEVAAAMKMIVFEAQTFPEEFKANVDGRATMEKLNEKTRTSPLIVLRDKEHVAAAVSQISKLLAGHGPQGQPGQTPPAGPGAPA